jgi:glucokinase
MSSSAKNYQACVDIGGTKVAVSLAGPDATRSLQLEARSAEPTAKEGANDALAQQIIRMIEAGRAEIGAEAVSGVGVSSCGPFVMRGGAVELAAPNICGGLAGPERGLPNTWMSAQLQAPLAARYGRVRVENDAVAALEAERRWGALQGASSCAYVTWSTGIGMGLCVDGHVLRGKNGNAGHAGHSFVSDGEALCGCGNTGDLEGMVAGNAIARRFAHQGFADASSLFAAHQSGDAKARAIVDELCRIMGRALYNLIATLDLQRISMGGSVFWHNRDVLLPLLRAEVADKLPSMTAGVEIVPAGLGLQVGDYAALALLD